MARFDGGDPQFAKLSAILLVAAASMTTLGAADTRVPLHFLVTNDDSPAAIPPSTVSFYSIGAGGALSVPRRVSTGGNGIAGGFFGIARLLVAPSDPAGAGGSSVCVYASNAQSENISGIDARTENLIGLYRGSRADNKLARNGIGLAANTSHLYAAFSGSGNIGVFQIQPGCKLQFVADVHPSGLHGGAPEGMALHANLMVVAYGDGSIESFDTSGALPVSQGDAQYSTGSQADLTPGSVQITRDGRYAIFGGGSTASAVEVSDISSGKLTQTVVYSLGNAWNSGSVLLSPDERLLYIANNSGGRVTAAFFDKTTGKVRPGCTSAPLKDFYTTFTYIGGVATELTTGAGGLLYVPEFSPDGKSSIGLLRFTPNAAGCTLTEAAKSPVASGPGSALLSIEVYPPKPSN